MCKSNNKFLIECYINELYAFTTSNVFETQELAENYINLYLKGRENCTFFIKKVDYFFNKK